MKSGDISTTAIVFIICGLLLVIFFAAALMSRVPGLFGKLLGYIQTGLISVGSTILDFLMKIFGKYFSAFATAIGVTLNVVLPVLTLQAVWPTLSTLGKIGIYALKEGVLKDGLTRGWSLIRSGLTRQAITKGLTNLIKTAGVMFLVSLGAQLLFAHFGVPQAIDDWAHGVCPNCPNIGWSWGSALTSVAASGLGLAAIVALGLGPIGWVGAALILAGSFIIGGFIH